jgi:hypothetical protein
MFSLSDTVHLNVHTRERKREKLRSDQPVQYLKNRSHGQNTSSHGQNPGDPLKTEGQAEPMY